MSDELPPYPGFADGVRTVSELEAVVKDYLEFDEFVFDVESMGPYRGDPNRNDVFWISLAGPGRADVVPCGHPLGERIPYASDDTQRRIAPSGHHQERRINPESGREKWFDVPEPFTEPPTQLWVSDVTEILKPLFFSERRKVGQNVKFDILSMAKYYRNAVMPPPYGDTLVAAKLINENHFQYDLGNLVKREFKFEYDKIGKKGPEKFPYSEACLYSYLDSKYTWLLWQRYKHQLEQQGVDHIFALEMDLLSSILDMEHTGIPIDGESLNALGEEFALQMARLQTSLDDAYGGPINLNANRQIAELVYDKLGKMCQTYTPSGERSTSKETLELFQKSKTVRQLLEHAKLRKLHSTFIVGLKDKVVDGRVHPTFNQAGAVSGRLSASSPNIQQIPSRSEQGKRVRDVFVASPGNVLVVSDLSQIELRTLAHFTQDRQLLKAYREGLDLHAITAERVFGPKFTSIDRTYAKNANFSIVFGVGPATLARKYQVPSVKMAKELLAGFYASYRRVEPWKHETLDEARAHYKKGKSPPYIETILGRKRRLPELYSTVGGLRARAERQVISTRISGSAADLFKVVMIKCQDLLDEAAWEGHILMTVHDELVVEVPERWAEEGKLLVSSAMTDPVNPFTLENMLTVPVIADTKIVDVWGAAK